jgi:hypothetical protein
MQVPAERYPLGSRSLKILGKMFSAKTGKSIRFWPARVPGRYNITWATETFIIPCATASLPPIGVHFGTAHWLVTKDLPHQPIVGLNYECGLLGPSSRRGPRVGASFRFSAKAFAQRDLYDIATTA